MTNTKITPFIWFESGAEKAVSFYIDVFNNNPNDQNEIDYFWKALGEGGETGQCGWINHDKFGLTWQIVPSVLTDLISNDDQDKREQAMKSMIKMTKIIIDDLG